MFNTPPAHEIPDSPRQLHDDGAAVLKVKR